MKLVYVLVYINWNIDMETTVIGAVEEESESNAKDKFKSFFFLQDSDFNHEKENYYKILKPSGISVNEKVCKYE